MNAAALKITAEIVPSDFGLTVRATWADASQLDRSDAHAWGVGKNRKLAERLVRAIEAGRALTAGELYVDALGKRGRHARSNVSGRTLNADLKRLGF